MKIAMFMLLFALYSWYRISRESFLSCFLFMAICLILSALGASGGEIAFIWIIFLYGHWLYHAAYGEDE